MEALNHAFEEVGEFKKFMEKTVGRQEQLDRAESARIQFGENRAARRARERAERREAKASSK